MKVTHLIAFAVMAVTSGLGAAQATSLRNAGEPAEFPPSSYDGRQYVDSEGCVFVRAGIDGNVTWVPRVSRSRETICGQQPSLATARAPEPAAAPAPKPKAVASAPAPKPAPKRVVRTTPKPAKKVVHRVPAPVPARTIKAARSAPVLAVTPKPAPLRVRSVKAQASGCPGASALSSRYMKSSGFAVRCGPQSDAHVTRVQGTQAVRVAPSAALAPVAARPLYRGAILHTAPKVYVPRTAAAKPQTRAVDPYSTRVAPRHVVRKQRRAAQQVAVPEGYKRVWTDGRLNPHRAHQTLAGKAAMERMWTKTTPRRLILTDTGREVTAEYPGLIYPYTSYEQQRAAMSARSHRAASDHVTTVSTKSRQPEAAPAPRAKVRPASHRFVQAGAFASRAQAQQAARRLAGSGLPTRLGHMMHDGTRYSLVLSGPYRNQSALNNALSRVRRAGFGNARLR